MGGKYKLLPWIWENLDQLQFSSALDLFSGTGSVSYLFKAMGKQVVANDFLNFAFNVATATIANSTSLLDRDTVANLQQPAGRRLTFVEDTFTGIFFEPADLRFLDTVWSNLQGIHDHLVKSIVIASLTRACLKRQPRGVFTVNGSNYDDGRRDLRLSLADHFLESVDVFNSLVFDNGLRHRAIRENASSVAIKDVDLVYMDPPYVPRADDNCYIKRYHFIEGLSSYWRDEGTEIVATSKVKKIPKRFTPFSYRSTAAAAFDEMFRQFAPSTLVLSYSSNGFPDLATLVEIMNRYKRHVDVVRKEHRYHFGTHKGVSKGRALVDEYLIIGQE